WSLRDGVRITPKQLTLGPTHYLRAQRVLTLCKRFSLAGQVLIRSERRVWLSLCPRAPSAIRLLLISRNNGRRKTRERRSGGQKRSLRIRRQRGRASLLLGRKTIPRPPRHTLRPWHPVRPKTR